METGPRPTALADVWPGRPSCYPARTSGRNVRPRTATRVAAMGAPAVLGAGDGWDEQAAEQDGGTWDAGEQGRHRLSLREFIREHMPAQC